jgi:hypothetical protein
MICALPCDSQGDSNLHSLATVLEHELASRMIGIDFLQNIDFLS